MILLIEMQCKDWEHNRVNSGILRQLKTAFPSEVVKLYAEGKHISELSKLLLDYNINFDFQEIDFDDCWRQRAYESKSEYEQLLTAIIKDNPEAREVILLSCNKGIIMACREVSVRCPRQTFYIVFHAALEEICHYPRNDLRTWFVEKMSVIRHSCSKPLKLTLNMKECIEKCDALNCKFVIYSPNYRKGLENRITQNVIDKIIFLHHPFYDSKMQNPGCFDKKIKIGIYGQAVNQNAMDIVKTYNRKYDNGTVEFRVMAQQDAEILSYKNVMRLFGKDYVSNKEFERAIDAFDYVLIPYNKDQYIVTASGIFCDAVSQEKPILMLDSPYFAYYAKYNIGLMEDSIEKMAKKISELYTLRENMESYVKAEIELKKSTFDENVSIMQEIMKVC